MIPEVGGTRPWALEGKGPKYLKGPKTTYTTIAIAEKQSKRSKKGPFLLYVYILGPPGYHPGNGIHGAWEKVPLGPPGFSLVPPELPKGLWGNKKSCNSQYVGT